MSGPLLQADRLVVRYPAPGGRVVHAVNGVSLELHPGETLALVGESGCGKSSLGRALLRLEPLAAGRLVAFGEDISTHKERHLRPLRRYTAMVFQDPLASLNPRMRLGASVMEPLMIHRVGAAPEREARARALMARVGLPDDAFDRRPHQLSGGQLQRVGIARALALDPALVVADEPVSALDVSVQAAIINLMQDLQRERGLAWLFIAHDLKVVEHLSDRVIVMYLGQVMEAGPTRSVFLAPRHPYTRALLDASPTPDPRHRAKHPPLEGEVPSPLDPPSGCPFHPRCARASAECVGVRPALHEGVACHHPLDM